jgi:polysaccharide export outer membrane protein
MIPLKQTQRAVGKKAAIFMGISLTFFVFGCTTDQSSALIKVSPTVSRLSSTLDGKSVPNQFGSNSIGQIDNNYTIGPEDVIEVSVWKNNDLSKTVVVRPDGQISLPLVGDIKAGGLTPTALKDSITNKLKEYKEDPIVSIIVKEINSYNIFVMGEVVRPGKYNLKSNTTLLQALSLAGGFTPYASRNKIILIRKNPRTLAVTEMRVRYDTILSGKDPQRDILLQPGDTIVVP